MITGYFYSYIKESNSQVRQLNKMAKILLSANGLYFLYALLKNILKGHTVLKYLGDVFNRKALLSFVFLNESPFEGHLWYLGSVFYVLIILFLVEKRWDREKLYPYIPVLLLTDLILGKYSRLILEREFPYILVRNYLCVGLPYFLIGDIFFRRKPAVKSGNWIVAVCFFGLTTLLERFALVSLNANTVREHYLSTTFLAAAVFLLAVNAADRPDSRVYKWCCLIGSKGSLGIYILHPIIIDVLSKVMAVLIRNDSLRAFVSYVCPFFVFLISIATSWMLYLLGEQMKRFRNDRKTGNGMN